nr:MAG TPA: Complement C5-like protein [Caudoviricetes sp.]
MKILIYVKKYIDISMYYIYNCKCRKGVQRNS